MANTLVDFIKHLNTQVNNGSIYVWGGQGETASESFIKKCESGKDETRALNRYRKNLLAGYDPDNIKCFDCSGLGMYWLKNVTGLSKTDLTANGMMGKCTLIGKSDLRKGCWVFKRYKTGSKNAYHIGYVVDNDLNVVEALGRKYGVVKRPLRKGGWNAYGIPSYFKKEIVETGKDGGEINLSVFTRVMKKGHKGIDVEELQKLLVKNGANLEVDGSYGSKTQAAVKTFQKKHRFSSVDGQAGEHTVTMLGGYWGGTPTKFKRDLEDGSKGSDVEMLQVLLRVAGHNIAVDGKFGQKTEIAVEAFQKKQGMTITGVAGEKVILALGGVWVG